LDPERKKAIDHFNASLERNLNDENFQVDGDGSYDSFHLLDTDVDDDYYDNTGVIRNPELIPKDEEYGDMLVEERPEVDDEEAIDKYLNAELMLDMGTGNERFGRVVKRARDINGNPIGRAHSNPLLDSREYHVEFTDGTQERYAANIIAENMYAQVDEEGRQFQVLEEIVDHMKDNSAVPISEGYTTSRNGERKPKITTKGHKLLCRYKGGSTGWQKLKDIKESNPIEVAEFAVANNLVEEPAFKWWVPSVLRRRNRIISKAKSRYWRTTHKFGIKLPHSVAEALEIDRVTGTDFWRKAINKEMQKVKVAWKVHEGHTPDEVRRGQADTLIGYQEIGCHLVFDVKMDFTRKARFCAGGHTTEAPASVTYSSVVSRDSVRLAFLIAGLRLKNFVEFLAVGRYKSDSSVYFLGARG
jgi:hypothetical protein